MGYIGPLNVHSCVPQVPQDVVVWLSLAWEGSHLRWGSWLSLAVQDEKPLASPPPPLPCPGVAELRQVTVFHG